VKGYGFADIERKRPVTENTAFYIASTTKAFTALTLALMAEKKQVDLDAPISRYLRDAKWAQGVNPDSITLRQLLSHTHGIAGTSPVVWRTAFTGVHTNALLKELLQHHPAANSRAYRYTNLGYNIAGIIIDEVTRGKWQDALAVTVMNPLGMKNTSAYVSRFDSAQLAMPYVMDPTGPRRVHYAKGDANMQAAGGLVSTAADLAKWLEVQLNQGKLDGKQVFPQRVIAETQRIHAANDERRGETHFVGYTLGWNVAVVRGDTVLQHGGGFSTFRTLMAFSPARKIGVAVMVSEGNMGSGAIEFLTGYVLDRASEHAGWREKYDQMLAQLPDRLQQARAGIAADRQRRAARPQTLPQPLEAYTGTFEDPLGGTMRWTARDGRLWAEIGLLKSIAEVFDAANNRLRAELEPGTGEVFSFTFQDGKAVSVTYSNREYKRVN
jgi:CubicO group peptidase (beta-lactamase class C family)